VKDGCVLLGVLTEEALWLTPLVEDLIADCFFLDIGQAFDGLERRRILCDLSTSDEQGSLIGHAIFQGELFDVGNELVI